MAKTIDKNACEPVPTCRGWLDRALIELLQGKRHPCTPLATMETPPISRLEHRPVGQTRPASTTLMLPLKRNRIFVASSLELFVRRNRDPKYWFPVYILQWKINLMSAL